MTRSLPPVLFIALVVTCGPTEALTDEPALVVLVDGQTLTRSDADGVRPLFTFGQGVGADFVKVMQWEVRGRFIGGFAFLPLGDVLTYEYLLCSTRGEVLFHRLRVESGHPTLHLGADGSLAVAGDTGFLARADGSDFLNLVLLAAPAFAATPTPINGGPVDRGLNRDDRRTRAWLHVGQVRDSRPPLHRGHGRALPRVARGAGRLS